MEEASVILERHEQRINTLERDISDLKCVLRVDFSVP